MIQAAKMIGNNGLILLLLLLIIILTLFLVINFSLPGLLPKPHNFITLPLESRVFGNFYLLYLLRKSFTLPKILAGLLTVLIVTLARYGIYGHLQINPFDLLANFSWGSFAFIIRTVFLGVFSEINHPLFIEGDNSLNLPNNKLPSNNNGILKMENYNSNVESSSNIGSYSNAGSSSNAGSDINDRNTTNTQNTTNNDNTSTDFDDNRTYSLIDAERLKFNMARNYDFLVYKEKTAQLAILCAKIQNTPLAERTMNDKLVLDFGREYLRLGWGNTELERTNSFTRYVTRSTEGITNLVYENTLIFRKLIEINSPDLTKFSYLKGHRSALVDDSIIVLNKQYQDYKLAVEKGENYQYKLTKEQEYYYLKFKYSNIGFRPGNTGTFPINVNYDDIATIFNLKDKLIMVPYNVDVTTISRKEYINYLKDQFPIHQKHFNKYENYIRQEEAKIRNNNRQGSSSNAQNTNQ